MIALAGAAVLVALARPFVNDFASYEVVSGYAASAWTWGLLAGGVALAIGGVLVGRGVLVPVANVVAGLVLSLALGYSALTTAKRVEPEQHAIDCANRPSLGCSLGNALDHLKPGPPPATPSRWPLELALCAYVVISGAAALRRSR